MILSFEKPRKIRSANDHNEMHTSDSGISGTYVPNMSIEDQQNFKAKYISGDLERIEIRVTIGGVNCNIFVFNDIYQPKYISQNRNKWINRHKNIKFSINGKMDVTFDEWDKINGAIKEAIDILKNKPKI